MSKSSQQWSVHHRKIAQSTQKPAGPASTPPPPPRVEWECPYCHTRQSAGRALPIRVSHVGTAVSVFFDLTDKKALLRCSICNSVYTVQAKGAALRGSSQARTGSRPPQTVEPVPPHQSQGPRSPEKGRPAWRLDLPPDEPLVTAQQVPPRALENRPRPRGGNWVGRRAYGGANLTRYHVDDK